MIITKFLNKLYVSPYSIILIFLAFLAGLFKEIIIISLIIIIHELGHYFALYIYKWNVIKINLYPFGGIIKFDDKIDKPLNEELIVTIMGPLFQELLFIIVLLFYKYNIITKYIFDIFSNYNFTIIIFNLLPILPLDGAKLLNILLNKFLNFRLSYNINIFISILSLASFIFVFKNDTSYYMIIFFLIYQIYFYYKNKYFIFNKFILEKKLKKSSYIKHKKVNDIKKMYRNKRNLIKENGSYTTEYRYKYKK